MPATATAMITNPAGRSVAIATAASASDVALTMSLVTMTSRRS